MSTFEPEAATAPPGQAHACAAALAGPEPELLLGADRRIEHANAAAGALLGDPSAALAGRDLAALSPAQQADGSPSAEALAERIAAAATLPQHFTWRFGTGAGQDVEVLVRMETAPDGRLRARLRPLHANGATRSDEGALHSAALAVSTAQGDAVFRQLVRCLATLLDVEVAFIALPEPDTARLRMLAFYLDGNLVEDFEYELTGTPCETVLGQCYRHYPGRLVERFPLDADFARLGLESYAGYPLTGAGGEPLGLISVVSRRPLALPERVEAVLKIFAARAVTEIERRRSEAALRTAEASYRAIFEAAEDPVFVHDWDTGAIVDVNPRACEAYGYPREEMLRLTVADISSGEPPYTAENAAAHMARAKQGHPMTIEWHRRNRDGSLHWDEVRIKPAVIGGVRRLLVFTREITERKAAEEALRASEQQYRSIFESSLDGLVLLDADGRIVDANPAFCTQFGRDRERLIGAAPADLLPADGLAACAEVLARAQSAPAQAECRARRADGTLFDVELRAVPMRYRGRPHKLVSMRDITARREAEERLRQSEARYRLLFEVESDAIVLIDIESLRVVDANRAALEMYGYEREAFIGLPGTALSAEPEATLASIRSHAPNERVPLRLHRRRDGTVFPVEIAGSVFELAGRRTILAAIRDITERRNREEALNRSEARLRATVEAAFDSVIVIDGEGRVIEFNPAAERVFGHRRDAVLGRGLAELVIPPRHRAAHAAGLERHRRTGRSTYVGRRVEVTAMRADGSEFPAELAIEVAEGPDGTIYIGSLRDLTERKRAEAERSRLEAQLRQAQKMEAIGHLTGGIAHDFNNILTSIMGYLALAGDRPAAAEDARLGRHLDQAQAASRRARDLIQQMLTFSRGQRGTPRPVAAGPLLAQSLKLLRSILPATIEIDTEVERDLPDILIDPVHMEQVLLNLCINARDAMQGHGAIRIVLRAAEHHEAVCASCRRQVAGRFVELGVVDTGTGIAPEVLDRMFEPFYTTKEVGRGSGMGLATVHGIVHEHGGHVLVDTSARGTSFRVQFAPLDGRTAAPSTPVTEDPAPARGRLAGRILVVDDEPMVAEFMDELLTGWGLEVTVRRNPIEAEQWFLADPDRVDLVVTDQTMPKVTGLELAQRLTLARPELPVILYTGFGEGIGAEDAARSGICALIAKPVEPAVLFDALRAHLPGSVR